MAHIEVINIFTQETVKVLRMDGKTCAQIDTLANLLESTRTDEGKKRKRSLKTIVNYDNALL